MKALVFIVFLLQFFSRDNFSSLVMDSKFEIRSNIKFCYKLGKSANETLEMIQKVHGDGAVTLRTVFRWFASFKEGREEIEDDSRSGRPKEGRSEQHIQMVADILKNDRRMTTRLLEGMTGIPRSTINRILVEDLRLKKVCARFVPHQLTDDQMTSRVDHSLDMQETGENDRNFAGSIVTGDETWCFQYEPSTKRDSSEWVGAGDPRPKKSRLQQSRVKTLLTVFFDSKGIIHQEFTPQGQTVTGQYYLGVLTRLLARINRVRPEYKEQGSWSLLHDNAPAHKCKIVRAFLAKRGVVVLDHPPYSPDLAPADFWLFPKLKLAMKGERYSSIKDIQDAVTDILKGVPKEGFPGCFHSLFRRFQRCINEKGSYFE